ncbi:MAG TPA: hypothetical protein P5205_03530 [Candidatus Paceibacterota bacterium]|nr:hypothetical protein [Verrucomicrobiota bacterium]HSA09421.1 hypothetical protein [Candidatus Paceibacterota bacterium]
MKHLARISITLLLIAEMATCLALARGLPTNASEEPSLALARA